MILVLLSVLLVPVYTEGQKEDHLRILDTLLRNYDRRAVPGTPTEVECGVYIKSFGSVSEITMDYKADVYLKLGWVDPRLDHPNITEVLDLNDPKLVQAIWKPEAYFSNAKEADFQFVTVPNLLVRIKPRGEIKYILRLRLLLTCMMQLARYPMDEQICTMEIASFSKTSQELLFKWSSSPLELSPLLEMPQFYVKNIQAEKCDRSAIEGEYSCLEARIYLQRRVGFHLVQTYLPTFLLVSVSWLSFWLGKEQGTTRVLLSVAALLALSGISTGLGADSPKVSYIRAIDVWMGTCTVFIFAALAEFAVVNNYWMSKERFIAAKLQDEEIEMLEQNQSRREQEETLWSTTVDKKCQYLFPILFLIFNCIYWPAIMI